MKKLTSTKQTVTLPWNEFECRIMKPKLEDILIVLFVIGIVFVLTQVLNVPI